MGEQDGATAVFWRGPLLGLQAVGFLYFRVEEKEYEFTGISLRALTPCTRAPPPRPNQLPEVSPDAFTLRLNFSS